MTRFGVRLQSKHGLLLAKEPNLEEVRRSAAEFASWYSDGHNSRMMGGQAMTAEDALDCFVEAQGSGNRFFFLYVDGTLAGDADFRQLHPPHAEFAIMIGRREAQGLGLGTAFSRMLHHLAFEKLGLTRVFLTVLNHNAAGRRCYEKLGYVEDRGDEALAYVEGEDDIPMSITCDAFEEKNRELLQGMEIGEEEKE